ncbi:MAG: hypothetical protein HYW06_03085 [Gemmatimonadetes bacterium]|nr:hypothetical protein [Gemmatimonadota bacterium]
MRFDDAGNVRQERRWIGLRAMQEIQNLKVQFRSSSGAPGATITTVAAKEIDGPLAASVARVHNVGGISEGLVLLSGHCGPDTPPTSFVVWHEGRSFYCLDRETAQKEYADDDWKQEYQSMAISVPTQRAVVTIDFPPSHHAMEPGPSPVVFIAHTETLHVAETKRVKPGFSWSAGRATLSVDEPKIGLGYGITWMPPAKGAGGN